MEGSLKGAARRYVIAQWAHDTERGVGKLRASRKWNSFQFTAFLLEQVVWISNDRFHVAAEGLAGERSKKTKTDKNPKKSILRFFPPVT